MVEKVQEKEKQILRIRIYTEKEIGTGAWVHIRNEIPPILKEEGMRFSDETMYRLSNVYALNGATAYIEEQFTETGCYIRLFLASINPERFDSLRGLTQKLNDKFKPWMKAEELSHF